MAQKKSCTDGVNLYEDVLKCPGQKRLPGTRAYGWFIPRRWITKLAEPQKEAATTLKDYLIIKESHTLQADKKWIRLEFIPDKSSMVPEAQGEEGCKTMNNKATLVLPGTEEEQQATASMLLNEDGIFLVPQRNGKVRQFGDEAFTVSVTPSATTGASVTDESNTTLEISVPCETMPPFYYGDIVTADGTYSGETCKLKAAGDV
jgi:hypothetical protein